LNGFFVLFDEYYFGWMVDGRGEKIVAQELAALAKEVARVEMVRKYAGELMSLLMFLALMICSL